MRQTVAVGVIKTVEKYIISIHLAHLSLANLLIFQPLSHYKGPTEKPERSPRPPRRPTRRSKRRSHKRLGLRSLRENLLRFFTGCNTSSRTSIIFLYLVVAPFLCLLLAQTSSTSVTSSIKVFGYASGSTFRQDITIRLWKRTPLRSDISTFNRRVMLQSRNCSVVHNPYARGLILRTLISMRLERSPSVFDSFCLR